MNTTVYIIDGDAAVRDSLATVMGLSGHNPITFATGNEFLRQHETGRPVNDQCVVCEANLPDTTGIAVFEALRPRVQPLRFALLVSYTDAAVAARANRIGIEHVFFKPLVNRRLLTFVSETHEHL